jgi:hypothetical protein
MNTDLAKGVQALEVAKEAIATHFDARGYCADRWVLLYSESEPVMP